MAKIRSAILALAEKVTGSASLSADSIAGAIDLITDGYSEPPQAANQADSTADTVAKLVTDFNGLLDKLKEAGLMAADAADGGGE